VIGRALILDRDGVVNREVGYLSRIEDVQWVPGVWELCRTARDAGFAIVIVTNQSGIARGLYSEDDFHALMGWFGERFLAEGVELEGYYYCPHHPEHGVGEYRRECTDRKPGPGMLLRAARELELDLAASVMVGDRCSDVGAANAAGVGRIFLLAGTEAGDCGGTYIPVDSLDAVRAELEQVHG
jgi:D-glycero-D-manno-heptose 1,7-bisphosphate phosphatase